MKNGNNKSTVKSRNLPSHNDLQQYSKVDGAIMIDEFVRDVEAAHNYMQSEVVNEEANIDDHVTVPKSTSNTIADESGKEETESDEMEYNRIEKAEDNSIVGSDADDASYNSAEEREKAIRKNFCWVLLNTFGCQLALEWLKPVYQFLSNLLSQINQKLFRGGNNDDAIGLDNIGGEVLEAADPTGVNLLVHTPPAGLESMASSSALTTSASGGGGKATAVVCFDGLFL